MKGKIPSERGGKKREEKKVHYLCPNLGGVISGCKEKVGMGR